MLQILINLVRGKFVAMFLGTEGMGVSALFATSSNTIQRLSSLGLNLSIVKDVAASSGDPESLSQSLAVARRLITLSALLGALVCVLFSPLLSRLTFGDYSMSWQFVLLGAAVGLTVAANGQLSVLQGLHEVKRLSKASLVGGVTGLVVGVPLYYFFGTKGIVPAMVALALAMWTYSYVNVRRATPGNVVAFNWKSHRHLVRKLIALGLILMVNDLFVALVQYLVNIYINFNGSTSDVGLYQAANSLTNQYSGLVFTAMAMDYFPRLSKVVSDNARMSELVNRQTEIVAAVMAPAASLLIIAAPLAIRLLLTSEYLPVTPLMRWMGLSLMFRALMLPMGYIAFAKDNRKLFFWMEGIMCNAMTLSLCCGFFHFFGLPGLGYALVADNALCLVIYYLVNRRMYGYRISRPTLLMMTVATTMACATFASSLIEDTATAYILMSVSCALSAAWAFVSLRRRLRS